MDNIGFWEIKSNNKDIFLEHNYIMQKNILYNLILIFDIKYIRNYKNKYSIKWFIL